MGAWQDVKSNIEKKNDAFLKGLVVGLFVPLLAMGLFVYLCSIIFPFLIVSIISLIIVHIPVLVFFGFLQIIDGIVKDMLIEKFPYTNINLLKIIFKCFLTICCLIIVYDYFFGLVGFFNVSHYFILNTVVEIWGDQQRNFFHGAVKEWKIR